MIFVMRPTIPIAKTGVTEIVVILYAMIVSRPIASAEGAFVQNVQRHIAKDATTLGVRAVKLTCIMLFSMITADTIGVMNV